MSSSWNDRFGTWAKAPSATESDKIQHSITAVQNALSKDATLKSSTKVFVQGSYRNRVNVRQDSDVDIGVLYTGNLFGTHYPAGKSDADFNVVNVPYGYSNFKNDLESALLNHFGRGSVTRGDKAFDIHENTYRVDADAVPLMVHRRFAADGTYICGTQLNPDSGGRIINWPERLYATSEWPNQHYENGSSKNNDTARAYRAVVRIVKKLRTQMEEDGVVAAQPIKGFLIECLVWNAPNSCFTHSNWYDDVQAVLDHLHTYTSAEILCDDWTEVSGFKWLFKGDEAKRLQAFAFLSQARSFIGAR